MPKRAAKTSNATLLIADAFDFLDSLKPNSVDLIVSSPPYFMGKEYDTSLKLEDFIEHHKKLLPLLFRALKRCEFNKPFANIELYKGSFNDFLKSGKLTKPCVAWLDYDGPISADIAADIAECGVRLPLNSIVFFTIDAEPKKIFKLQTSNERRDYFLENFQSAASQFPESDFENEVFHLTSSNVLFKLVVNSFAQHEKAVFLPLFFSLYRDTTWMCTVGGIWSNPLDTKSKLLRQYARQAVPGLIVNKVQPRVKEIPQINISESERRLLDQIATQSKQNSKERALAKKLGFSKSYINKYKQIIRYIPRFIETAV